MGRAINESINGLPNVPIVELGPGTGAITKEILLHSPRLIEIDKDFCALLKKNFPTLAVECMDAVEYLEKLNQEVGLVISIPLINNPARITFLKSLEKAYLNGLVKWCIIYSYGFRNPLEGIHFKNKHQRRRVYLNLPPASVWVNS